MTALGTVARKSVYGKLNAKLIFDRAIYAFIADADIGRLKSFHTLFNKTLNHERNKGNNYD